MSGRDESHERRRRIDAEVKAACLEGLLKGERVRDLAASFGVTPQGLGKARKRDPVFDAGWRAAYAASAAAERWSSTEAKGPSVSPSGCHLPQQAGGGIEERIVANNRRGLQRRKMRHVKFDAKRQEAFLAHFAWSGDTLAAAAQAGVSESTVYVHRRKNPAFAAEYQAALDQGYARLEAEALRQRLAAQQALRAAVEGDPPPACLGEGDRTQCGGGAAPPSGLRPECSGASCPRQLTVRPGDGRPAHSPSKLGEELSRDIAAEFERVLKLLARWDRKARRPERDAAPGGRRVWTFDAAIALLDKRLKALGMAVPSLPPEFAVRYDGLAGNDGDEG